MRVYEITYRDTWKGKAWVDTKSYLPVRIHATFTEEYKDRVLAMEVMYDYQPIPVEKFRLTIPEGFTELPRIQPRLFSGKVIDEQGKPVAGAEIVTSNENILGTTNEHGEFAISLHPRYSSLQFPTVVRVLKADRPDRVAWTLLRNPKHDLRPLYRPDDGKAKLEQGGGVEIQLVDEKKLIEFIPGDPGKIVFEKEMDRYPSEVTNIVLQMGPASVITGRIVDQGGQPISNAVVWIDHMEIAVGENEIEIRDLRHTAKERAILPSIDYKEFDEIERKTFAVTDKDGRYELGHLPDVWYRVRLEVRADGYVSEAKEIFQPKGADFSLFEAGITIRGTVIDNHGQPLVGREVEIDVDSEDDRDFDVEEVFTDKQGRFELTGVPAVDGLELQVRIDEKPRDWDRNELTRGREFFYYLMIEESIKLEPGKKEYVVEIVPHRPDITLEIEVKDSKGTPLAGVPAGVCSPGCSEREWYISQLVGKTDNNGQCTITEVPRIDPLKVWICVPEINVFQDWESMRELSRELKDAINTSRSKYPPTIVTVELEEDKKNYKVSVTL
jgi:protocatechuate 3,4-dioxygenase beta subunit